jgi:hypothetical protein
MEASQQWKVSQYQAGIKAESESYGSDVLESKGIARYDVSRISLGFRMQYMPNSRRSYCKLHTNFNLISH